MYNAGTLPRNIELSRRIRSRASKGLSPSALGLLVAALAAPATAAPPLAAERASAAEVAARRSAVLSALGKAGEGAFLLLRAPPERNFAADVDYPYRPSNDLYYLTGLAEPRCALLLASKDLRERGKAILFIDPPPSHLRVWVGEGLTREAAAEASGIPIGSVLEIRELPDMVRELSPSRRAHSRPSLEEPVAYFEEEGGFGPGEGPTEPYSFLVRSLGSSAFHLRLRPPSELTHPLRQVKSAAEVRLIEGAVRATVKALEASARAIRPGAREQDIRAVIEGAFLAEGCEGWSFPPIVASGPNTCILHYPGYGRRIEEGDLVLLDIGAEKGFYAADVTRTMPASGKFSARQRAVYEAVLRAQEATIAAVRPGVPFSEVNATARREVAKALPGLGLAADGESPGKYLPHGTAHGVGLAVHDPMPGRMLAPGMVIAVEPGIYIPEEGIGVRIEDNVLVTNDGCRVLSSGAAKTVEGIEAWMREREF